MTPHQIWLDIEYALQRIEGILTYKENKQFIIGNQYTLADVISTCLIARVHMIKGVEELGSHYK